MSPATAQKITNERIQELVREAAARGAVQAPPVSPGGTPADANVVLMSMDDVIKAALDRMDKLFSRDGKFTRANIEHTQQISKELGIIKASYPYEDVVAPSARE